MRRNFAFFLQVVDRMLVIFHNQGNSFQMHPASEEIRVLQVETVFWEEFFWGGGGVKFRIFHSLGGEKIEILMEKSC